MKQKLLNHFSGWWKDLIHHPGDYYLILSDDMDSFYSCRYLQKMTGVHIGGFYDFGNGLYLTDEAQESGKQPVYVDCAVLRDGVMCFDNHRTLITNHMMINPNVITDRIDNKTYFNKYCGSTLMLLVALYGGKLSELEKQFVCTIDSFYIGWYKDNGKYRNVNDYWLDQLGLSDMLTPVLNSHDAQFFINLMLKYQLNEKIYISSNRLFTYADILPHDRFALVMPTEKRWIEKDSVLNLTYGNRQIFTGAETYNGKYSADFLKGVK